MGSGSRKTAGNFPTSPGQRGNPDVDLCGDSRKERDSVADGLKHGGASLRGHVHIQRIGDNTSGGNGWRTRKMGVNSLAFSRDAARSSFCHGRDCVGLTNQIPWRLNEQWMELMAPAGTSMFVSAQPEYIRKSSGRRWDGRFIGPRARNRWPSRRTGCRTRARRAGNRVRNFFEFNWWSAVARVTQPPHACF